MKRSRHNANCHPDRPHHARGLCGACYARFLWERGDKQVQADRWQKYYAKNKEVLNKNASDNTRKRLYGITPEEYDTLFWEQGGGCAICGSEPSGAKNTTGTLHVDHNH